MLQRSETQLNKLECALDNKLFHSPKDAPSNEDAKHEPTKSKEIQNGPRRNRYLEHKNSQSTETGFINSSVKQEKIDSSSINISQTNGPLQNMIIDHENFPSKLSNSDSNSKSARDVKSDISNRSPYRGHFAPNNGGASPNFCESVASSENQNNTKDLILKKTSTPFPIKDNFNPQKKIPMSGSRNTNFRRLSWTKLPSKIQSMATSKVEISL
jgi:hypothetical protein